MFYRAVGAIVSSGVGTLVLKARKAGVNLRMDGRKNDDSARES